MRTSNNEIKDGLVFNGYDYDLQVWVKDGKVMPCGHLADACQPSFCASKRYAGQMIKDIYADPRFNGLPTV